MTPEKTDFLTKANELIEKYRNSIYPKGWVHEVLFDLVVEQKINYPSRAECLKLAEMLGYKEGWGVIFNQRIDKHFREKEKFREKMARWKREAEEAQQQLDKLLAVH